MRSTSSYIRNLNIDIGRCFGIRGEKKMVEATRTSKSTGLHQRVIEILLKLHEYTVRFYVVFGVKGKKVTKLLEHKEDRKLDELGKSFILHENREVSSPDNQEAPQKRASRLSEHKVML